MEACHVKRGQGSCKSIPQIPVGKLAYQNCNRDQLSPRGGRELHPAGREIKADVVRSGRATAKVFLIPAFSIQGSDSEPGVLPAKQRPKVPAALHEPLAEPPLEPDR